MNFRSKRKLITIGKWCVFGGFLLSLFLLYEQSKDEKMVTQLENECNSIYYSNDNRCNGFYYVPKGSESMKRISEKEMQLWLENSSSVSKKLLDHSKIFYFVQKDKQERATKIYDNVEYLSRVWKAKKSEATSLSKTAG